MKKYSQVISKIKKYNTIICLRHINPDGDAYGSSMGIANFIRDNFPKKRVFLDGSENLSLSFLGKMDQVTKKDYEGALLIITDTNNTARIDSEHWKIAKEIIKIDHHPETSDPDTIYGDLSIVDADLISASELVAKILFNSKFKITSKTAKFLYTGIVTDSGRFLHFGVNSDTFEIAAKLIKKGVNINEIYDQLYRKDFKYLTNLSVLISKIQVSDKGIGYINIKKNEYDKLNLKINEIKQRVNIMSNIKEIKIWFIALETPKEGIKISIRSRKYIVNKVAAKYNGGGHKLASGAKIMEWSQIHNLITDLEKAINPKNSVFKN